LVIVYQLAREISLFVCYATFFLREKVLTFISSKEENFMTQAQGQTQDAQNAQQREYPANAESGYNETQGSATGDETQASQLNASWRPTEDPAIEQAGGTTQSSEEEPGRSQQDGKAQGAGEDAIETPGQGSASSGV
jgi:hypothetical protein